MFVLKTEVNKASCYYVTNSLTPAPPPAHDWPCRLPLSGSGSGSVSALGTGLARDHPSTHTQLTLQINESLQQMSPWLWALFLSHETRTIYCYHFSSAHSIYFKHVQTIFRDILDQSYQNSSFCQLVSSRTSGEGKVKERAAECALQSNVFMFFIQNNLQCNTPSKTHLEQ